MNEVTSSTNQEIIEVTFKEYTTKNEMFCQFDDYNGVLYLDVKNPFTAEDFDIITSIIDPYYQAKGELKGIIINAKKFPHWISHVNREEYIHFASENHRKFQKAAFAMGGWFIRIIIMLGKGRAYPQLKRFGYKKIEQAQDWIVYGK